MADIGFDLAPGYYLENKVVNMQLSARVQSLQYSVNGGAPALSKYIAYDTSNPPVPFVAVTDDGRGKVVYDGGFPKFYNNSNKTPALYKYTANILNYLASPAKTSQGNKRVLVIGDAVAGQSYTIKGSANSDFSTTLPLVIGAAGYQVTLKDRNDWGGIINPSLAELEGYCLVIVFSTVSQSVDAPYLITPEAIEALMTYRENGSGIFLVTDHGPNINTIDQVAGRNMGGFFATANAIAVNFGAWFSGTYDRVPVNVGFLRATYGDHPLYAGMSDSEDFPAGGSESRVFVAQYDSISPSEVQPIAVGTGRTVIQVAAVLTTGEIVTYRATYWVGSFKLAFSNGEITADNGYRLDVGIQNQETIYPVVIGTLDEPATGTIHRNNQQIGRFDYAPASGVNITWNNGQNGTFAVKDGDIFRISLTTPFILTSEITLKRFQPALDLSKPVPLTLTTLKSYRPTQPVLKTLWEMLDEINAPFKIALPENLKVLRNHFNS